ncbi:MAG: type II secretion system protein [Nitrospirae bacterium]|nr:MAG: type II secretion system protein [Nitrospirota bacterium]
MRKKKNRPLSYIGGPGFTLLEVLVAVAIIGGTVVVLMQSLSWHLELLGTHKKATEAVFLAEDILREVTPRNMDSPAIKTRLEEARKDGFDVRITTEEGPIEGIKTMVVEVFYDRESVQFKKVLPGYF